MPESEGQTPEQNLTWFVSGFARVQERRKTVSSLLSGKKKGSYENILQKPFTLARKTGFVPALRGGFHGLAKGAKGGPLFQKKAGEVEGFGEFSHTSHQIVTSLASSYLFSQSLHCYKT